MMSPRPRTGSVGSGAGCWTVVGSVVVVGTRVVVVGGSVVVVVRGFAGAAVSCLSSRSTAPATTAPPTTAHASARHTATRTGTTLLTTDRQAYRHPACVSARA